MHRNAIIIATALSLAGPAAFAAAPGDYLATARGRIHTSTSSLATVAGWKDDNRGCSSRFEFVSPGRETVLWTINWKEVRNVQISTRKYFITDVEDAAYHQQPGLILYGRNTTSGKLPDGTTVRFDNLEFFIKDPAQMDYAFTRIRDYARACRRR